MITEFSIHKKLRLLILPLLLFVSAILFNGFCKENSEPLVLKSAGNMKNYGNGDKMWSHLSENVEFQHGKINLKSKTADYYRAQQSVELIDSVIMSMPNKVMTAQRINYKKNEQRIEALGNVKLYDKSENLTLTGKWGEYFRDKKIARIFGRPVLTRIDTTNKDTIFITSDSMIYYENLSKTSVLGNVVIIRGKSKLTGGKGDFFEKDNNAFLYDKPIFYLDSNVLSGEIMKVVFKDNVMDKIYVSKNAYGIYSVGTENADTGNVTEVFGDSIEIYLVNQSIKNMLVKKNARSLYYKPPIKTDADLASGALINMKMSNNEINEIIINGNASSTYHNKEANKVTGKNVARGDSIHVFFKLNKVSSVNIRGGAEGQYFIKE